MSAKKKLQNSLVLFYLDKLSETRETLKQNILICMDNTLWIDLEFGDAVFRMGPRTYEKFKWKMFYNTRDGLYSKQCQHSTYVGEIQLDLSLIITNHKITQYIDSIFYFYSYYKFKIYEFFLTKNSDKNFFTKREISKRWFPFLFYKSFCKNVFFTKREKNKSKKIYI